jgi:hypothetical protein
VAAMLSAEIGNAGFVADKAVSVNEALQKRRTK